MNRPSGLAVVGYGLTLVGFIQVAATIAPRVAASLPEAGSAATAVGAAIALAIDICWAALMHTTLTTYRNGQTRPALGFGAATAAAVGASTILLASVGHMGPWSVVPVLAALLLVADGIREHVSVSPETAAIIRDRTAAIRDARALATIEARHDAHTETIHGYRESARLAARATALATIRTTVQRAESQASRRIERATKRYGATPALPVAPPVARDTTRDTDATGATPATPEPVAPVAVPAPEPVAPPATPSVALSLVASGEDEIDAKIRAMVADNVKPAKIAEELDIHRATVYRRIRAMGA